MANHTDPVRLIIGCGYLGIRVARLWLSEASTVLATTRSQETAQEFRKQGLHPVIWDVLKPSGTLPAADVIVYCVGFDRNSGHSMRDVYVDGLKAALESLDGRPRLFLYVSSTGVYGDAGGGWVDESTPENPEDAGGKVCLEAEQTLKDHARATGLPYVVLRLAGLYGPERMIGAGRVAKGTPVGADPDAYLNLIHVEDAARVVEAAREKASPGETYLVADGRPVKRRDFYGCIAELLQTEPPVFAPQQSSRSRGDRRVSNRKMLNEFGVKLTYPDFRSGLKACW